MENLAADFSINDNNPLEAEYTLEQSDTFDCSFEIYASGVTWGNIAGNIENQTDLINVLDGKQDTLTAGDNVQIVDNVISATDTTYTAGTGISIENGVISNTQTSAEWGNITGTLSDQTDLNNALDTLSNQIADNHSEITNIDLTIQGYGDIVTYNAADFATSIQGGLADTALQPGDNISELDNDAGYITGIDNSDVITALGYTPYDSTNPDGYITAASLPTVNDGTLTIKVNGTNLATFSANQGTDTIADVTIPGAEWGNITGTLSNQTDLKNALDTKPTNNATGSQAIALGSMSTGTGTGSIAYGYSADATSTYATAIGWGATASNTNTIAIGKSAKATAAGAIVLGTGSENSASYTFQVSSYKLLDLSDGLIPDARLSTNIARSADIPSFNTTQMAAINSGANTTNIGQIATNTQDISDEIINRQNADNGLQSQIDALVVSSDVFDVVGTYADLQAYDISTVPVNDIIKVLVDSTHSDAATYYRCVESGGVKSWSYIGAEGAYYTKSEADNLFVAQTVTINGQPLSANVTLTAADVGALPDTTVIPTVNDSTITIQKNGTAIDTFTLNQSSNETINISVPTDTSDLTNGAGFITGITSGDVTTALGYTPYSDANPNGYTSNVGTVTSVNNVSPVSGNVTLSIPTDTNDLTNGAGYITSSALTNYVTTNTAQTISAKKTFTGEKAILFKQTSNSDKLGFTLYNSSDTELGAFEYRPNTISGAALLNVNTSYSNSCYVGFRYWGTAVNIIAPKVATAGNYYIPTHITDGNTKVTASNTGSVNISSLLPDISTKQDTLVSGTNIKTINNTSLLGSGNIDTSEVFVAEYGVTSYADVLTAYNAGKSIFAKVQAYGKNLFVALSEVGQDVFYFVTSFVSEMLVAGKGFTSFSLTSNGWSYTTTNFADTDLSNLSATGQGIIDAKVNTSDYYFAINDTISMTYVGGGFLTNSGKSILFSVPLPKSLANITTITCTAMTANFRKHSGGYLPSSGWNAKANGTITISKQDDFLIYFEVQYNSYSGTNNTPVGVQADISLKFT